MNATLMKENETLKAQIKEQTEQIKNLQLQIDKLLEALSLKTNKVFGVKSEKNMIDSEGYKNLFNEAEEVSVLEQEEPTFEEVTEVKKKRKKKATQEETFQDLPVETIEYTIDEADRGCPFGHGPLKDIGVEVTKELVYQPAKYYIREHVHHSYACSHCEKKGNESGKTPIMTATKPKRAIPGSIASPSIIAHVIDQKYTMGLPLYRQEQQFQRQGLPLSRQTQANWVIKSADVFKVFYDRLHEVLKEKEVLMADETTLQVLRESGRDATTKSYMWVYRTGKYDNPIILYDYQETRAGMHPKSFLKGFKGYLHSDGYKGYNNLGEEVTLIGCFAHARRRFADALKALPQEAKKSRTTASEGIAYINKLYTIEREIKDLSIEERHRRRQNESKLVLDAFWRWLNEKTLKVLPKSTLGNAISYTINQWDDLSNYTLDGRLDIDNNRTERAIRPFVVGRKGWLFSNTPRGASASAIIYSMVETAKENKLKPYDYLKYLLEAIPNIDTNNPEEIDALFPWSEHLPEGIKS